jgi:hypothetical protein
MKLEKVEKILQLEWNMFQKVENIGGRASCQEDFETFYIMRRSQYENWTDEMLDVWTKYVEESEEAGRNLLSEKYARMMQYSDLHYYNKHLKYKLPVTPVKIFRLINEIVEQLILWEEDLGKRYPLVVGTGRPLRSEEDYKGQTSLETYARGELETYPEELLILYRDYVKDLASKGISLSENNQLTMVKLYGYETIEEAEESLKSI